MSKTFTIDPFELKEHEKASALIPEMSEERWSKFYKNIKEVGIRQPIDINMKKEVLDGRHRLKGAKLLKFKKIEVRQHDLSEVEEMEFVRDTAIERRELTPNQKLDIILSTQEMTKGIYEKGRNVQGKRSDLTFYPTEQKVKKPHNSNREIAEMAGSSLTNVTRLKKIRKEEPNVYKEVVEGKKTPFTAYENLESIKNKKTNKPKKPIILDEKEETPELTKEQIKKEMFHANVSTFFRHLTEVEGFIGRTEDFEDVVKKAIEEDKSSMQDFKKSLQKIIILMED